MGITPGLMSYMWNITASTGHGSRSKKNYKKPMD